MKIGVAMIFGLGTVILSALGQETNVATLKTNATETVPAVTTERAGAGEQGVSIEPSGTNTTELAGSRQGARDNAADLINPAFSTMLSRRSKAPDEIVTGKTTLKGPLVVFFNNRNPLAVFNPFQPELPGEKAERPLSDPYLGAPRGIVLFSLHR